MNKPLRDRFPQLYVQSANRNAADWGSDLPVECPTVLRFLLAEVGQVTDSTCRTSDDVLNVALPIRQEAIAEKAGATDDLPRHACDLLNLYLCITGIGAGVHSGRLSDAYDWVVLSLCDLDRAGPEVEIDPGRVSNVLACAEYLGISEMVGVVGEWCSFLFYIARVRSTFAETCDLLLPLAVRLSEHLIKTGDIELAVDCLLSVAGWAVQHSTTEAAPIVARLGTLYDASTTPPRSKASIGIGMSTAIGSLTNDSAAVWAADVLEEFGSYLRAHEELQLLCATVDSIVAADMLHDRIVAAATAHAQAMRGHAGQRAALRYGGERLFDVLRPHVAQLCLGGRADHLVELLCAWYGVETPRRSSGVLFITCDESNVYWFTETEQVAIRFDNGGTHELLNLTQQRNAFLGTTVTVEGSRDLPLQVSRLPGVPKEDQGPEFQRAIESFYRLGAPELKGAKFADAEAMLAIPNMSVPLQPALLAARGKTFPIAVSLQQPAKDRPIRNVLIWPGGTLVDSLETAVVQAAFTAAGCSVEVVHGDARTKARFVEAYEASSYDLIWVVAHGEFDHFSPHTTYVSLRENGGDQLSLLELETLVVPQEGRRLLVLNICDGATGAVLKGALGLGLAHSLACAHQAVVSHGWPVDQRISPVFAALFSAQLAGRDGPYFDAFCEAVAAINQEKADLVHAIGRASEAAIRIAEYVANRSSDPTNIYFWGSPLFME